MRVWEEIKDYLDSISHLPKDKKKKLVADKARSRGLAPPEIDEFLRQNGLT